jgi:hypothetical protein
MKELETQSIGISNPKHFARFELFTLHVALFDAFDMRSRTIPDLLFKGKAR